MNVREYLGGLMMCVYVYVSFGIESSLPKRLWSTCQGFCCSQYANNFFMLYNVVSVACSG